MKSSASSPESRLPRRSFLKKSLAATVAAPLVMSMEEHLLSRHASAAPSPMGAAQPRTPTGKIGKVEISRLICGGNLISGYAHSRDLIYVSKLIKHYFTEQKIVETWQQCEAHGINTMVASADDPRAISIYREYRKNGGRIQYLAQIGPDKNDLEKSVREAAEAGAVGALLLGNLGDLWTRQGDVARIGELVKIIQDYGLIAGVAGHELRTAKSVEEAGIEVDFHMKTLHSTDYWSTRRPEQEQEVIDNYSIDNYWCRDGLDTIRFMSELERPWIAYKVLAAGAVRPQAGFRHAFKNGADFAVVGMFDFQVAEDVQVACQVIQEAANRDRDWMA